MAIYRGLPTILSPFCPLRWVWPRRSASACAGGRPAASTGVSSSCWPRSCCCSRWASSLPGGILAQTRWSRLPAPCRCRRSARCMATRLPVPCASATCAAAWTRWSHSDTPTIKTRCGSPCSTLPLSLSLRWVRASVHSASASSARGRSGFPARCCW